MLEHSDNIIIFIRLFFKNNYIVILTTFYGFRMRICFKKVNYYKVAKKTIHKPSLDHNMIVTKVGVTLGPSTRKIDKFREDTAKDSQPIMDAAPINRKLSNCEKTRVHHRKRYVAWIFDKRMNPLYNSYSIMDSKTKKKFLQNASSQSEKLTTKRSRRIWGILICYQFFFSNIF